MSKGEGFPSHVVSRWSEIKRQKKDRKKWRPKKTKIKNLKKAIQADRESKMERQRAYVPAQELDANS